MGMASQIHRIAPVHYKETKWRGASNPAAPVISLSFFTFRSEDCLYRMVNESTQRNSTGRNCTTAGELAACVQGELRGGGQETPIGGFASLKDAGSGDLSFLSDQRHIELFKNTKAGAVLVPLDLVGTYSHTVCIYVKLPGRAFDKLLDKYAAAAAPFLAGVHPSAVVAPTVKFDPAKVSIGACAVVEDGAEIADGVRIGPGCFVGRNARIGKDSTLFPNVTLQSECVLAERVILHSGVVIGGDGFGYEFENGRHRKVPQTGNVQIDNDVEIGANSTVDRARFGTTRIGEGTKIDNLVQIAHNVVIGKHCILVAFVALAGSAEVGDYVVIAGQSAVGGHLKVGSQSTLGARCGVSKDLPPGGTYLGYPAVPFKKESKRIAAMSRLPQLVARVKELERRVRGTAVAENGHAEDGED
jgi:UDP-3-O-[3-hydroxymyristoyl] glucosamine N-acyltransferase